MSPRFSRDVVLVVSVLVTAGIPAAASARFDQSIAVVADPVTLERAVTIEDAPVLLHVVYLNSVPGLGSLSAVEFRVELDPGLTLLGANSRGLVLQPAPGEYAISFPFCAEGSGPEPFELLQLVVLRTGPLAPGDGVRVESRIPGSPQIRGVACSNSTVSLDLTNLGGVVMNAAGPAVVAFASSEPVAVEDREYTIVWETVGGGEWLLDGVPVDGRGTLTLPATADVVHHLETADGAVSTALTIEVIRAPEIRMFTASDEREDGWRRIRWYAAGAVHCWLSGRGEVMSAGELWVDPSAARVIDLRATNEWGATMDALEFAPPSAPPEILDFHADRTSVTVGEEVWFTHRVLYATELRIEPAPGRVSVSSEATAVAIDRGGTWTLTATNSLGSASADVELEDPLPRIAYFRLRNNVFGPGESIEFVYETSGAEEVRLEPGGLELEPEGAVTITGPDTATTYQLLATNVYGTTAESLRVAPSAPRLEVYVQSTFAEGEPVELRYESRWSDRIVMTPPGIEVPSFDSVNHRRTLRPIAKTTYRMESTNAAGTTVRQFTLQPGPPKIVEFAVEPVPSLVGQPFEIIYRVYGAETLEFEGFPGFVLPDSASLASDRIPWAYPEAWQGSPKLTARNQYGFTYDLTDPWFQVRDRELLIDYFYFDPPTLPIPTAGHVVWKAPNYYEHVVTDENGAVLSTYYNGYKTQVPDPGTHYWVITSSHRSLVQTDTAWVTVAPLHAFSLERSRIYPGEGAVIRYTTREADRVRIDPLVGDLPPGTGEVVVPIDHYTEFVCSAWRNGAREVHELPVWIDPPTVHEFVFRQNWIMPDQPPWLAWSVSGADSVWITPPGQPGFQVAPTDSMLVEPPVYGWWSLSARNEVGTTRASDELYGPYLAVDEFRADPALIRLGESTTLRWDVTNALDVEIVGVGVFPPTGELAVTPEESRGYELYARGPDHALYRVAPVRVDLDADHPATIMVSASPDSFVHEPAPIGGGSEGGPDRYDVYVRVENVYGTVNKVRFALEWPEWLEVESWELNGEGSWSEDWPDRVFAVYPLWCEAQTLNSDWLARFRFVEVGERSDAVPTIGIRPGAADQYLPIPPQWDWCGRSTNFEFSLPGMALAPAEPMRLAVDRVGIRVLPLTAEWTERGLRLQWPDVAQDAESRVLRARGTEELAPVAWVEGNSWTDHEAAALSVPDGLRYQVLAGDAASVSFRSQELRVEPSPDRRIPERTRLVGVAPNPFNPRTTISFELARVADVRIAVHDVSGRLVRDWSLPAQAPGTGAVIWEGTDQRGRRIGSGVYLVRLEADGVREVRRVTLLK